MQECFYINLEFKTSLLYFTLLDGSIDQVLCYFCFSEVFFLSQWITHYKLAKTLLIECHQERNLPKTAWWRYYSLTKWYVIILCYQVYSRFACLQPNRSSNQSQHKTNGALVLSNSSVNQFLRVWHHHVASELQIQFSCRVILFDVLHYK